MSVSSFATASAGLQPYEQTFTSSGTWTKPAGVKTCEVTVIGGGRNFGAGGYVKKIIDVSGLSTVPVVVGASAGNSSFGTLIAATGPDEYDQGSWYDTSIPGTSAFLKESDMVGQPFSSGIQPGDIRYGNGVYLAISNGSQWSATSTDGITWTQTNTGSTYSLWWYSADQVNYGGLHFWEGKFRYAYGGKLYSSTDGITWTSANTPAVFQEQPILRMANGKLFLLGRESGGGANANIYTSIDGVNWTQVFKEPNANSYNSFKNISYANGIYLLTKQTSLYSQSYKSTDLTNWTQVTVAAGNTMTGTVWGDGNYFMCVVTSTWQIYYSTNGSNWSSFNAPEYADFNSTTNPTLMSLPTGGFLVGGAAQYNAWLVTAPAKWSRFSTVHYSGQWWFSGCSNGKIFGFSDNTNNYGFRAGGYSGALGNKGQSGNSIGGGGGSGAIYQSSTGGWTGGLPIDGYCSGATANTGIQSTSPGSARQSGLVKVRWWA